MMTLWLLMVLVLIEFDLPLWVWLVAGCTWFVDEAHLRRLTRGDY